MKWGSLGRTTIPNLGVSVGVRGVSVRKQYPDGWTEIGQRFRAHDNECISDQEKTDQQPKLPILSCETPRNLVGGGDFQV